MGTIKDGIDLGIEAVQFWLRFKGRRVRVWPSDLTIRICSESGRKWVTSADLRASSAARLRSSQKNPPIGAERIAPPLPIEP